MNLEDALNTYIAESRELLESMEEGLLRVEQEHDKGELLNAIFRAAHTIKGSAGLFGLDDIVAFTHVAESLLDKLRDGKIALTKDLVALLLACKDHISELVEHVASGGNKLDDSVLAKGNKLINALNQAGGAVPSESALTLPDEPKVACASEHDSVETSNWHISLRFGQDSLRNGMDPLSFLRYLGTLGKIINIVTLDDHIPETTEMDAESCYLGFDISFQSDADKQAIEDVFEFIRHDSLIRVLPPSSSAREYIELIRDLPEDNKRVADILLRCGSLTQAELDEIMIEQEAPEPAAQTPDSNTESNTTVTQGTVEKQPKVRDSKIREAQSVRVDAEKLDKLIDLVGELVIASAGTALNAAASGQGKLIESASTLTRLVEEVRDSALSLRMVQIGATFNRFQRVVRDVSSELNKEINLVITGAETELDKTVIEKISDPLMHLVRNAIDHGIEAPQDRISAGKSSAGTLHLNAYHDSGSIVLEVSDDGAGLNRDKIMKKAIEKGLVVPEQNLEDQEVYGLIFEPGFSTADQVSNLSGRGVGMDVVKRNITALRGTVTVDSRPGQGTTFCVRMPLTLAIIDGFLVGVDDSSFVVPLDIVLECVELEEVVRNSDGRYINLHGEVLPFIRLREMFGMGGQVPRRENLVVVRSGGIKAGLVVDRLMGEFQTVIKPLNQIFKNVHGLGGSTILGNGQVALILDVPGLVDRVSQTNREERSVA